LLDFRPEQLHLAVMKLILSTHNVTLTKAIEDHLLDQIDKLEHLDRWAIDARVTLEQDHPSVATPKFTCSLRLGVRGPDLFAEARANDLYAAMDDVIRKIQQQIRKRHNKNKARKHTLGARTKRSRQESDES
jgi:putative sigma-54 modulation protein